MRGTALQDVLEVVFSRISGGCAPSLLHEVGKVAGEARRMGCGKQESVVEGSRLWSCKPAGFEAAGHTPSIRLRRPPSPAKLGKGCAHLRIPRAPRSGSCFLSNISWLRAPLLHEAGKVAGEARRMGCGKQECVVEGSRLWSCKPAGFEVAGHTPTGPPGHLPQQAAEGVRSARARLRRPATATTERT